VTKCLPDIFFVGPERTGTTWIHRYLASRGDIRLPAVTKETFFFDRHYARGIDWYLSHFDATAQAKLTIEVAPTYFHSADAGRRIHQWCPEARIVCTLRDPVKRSYSHFQHMRAYGGTGDSLKQAVAEHPQILDASRYAGHIRRLQAEFGADRVDVLLLDDLAEDAELFARQLCERLGLEYRAPESELGNGRVNSSGTPRHPRLARLGNRLRGPLRRARMFGLIGLAKRLGLHQAFFGVRQDSTGASADDLAFLRQALAAEVPEVEQLLGRELPRWRSASEAGGA
jgi:hypothetical protein